MKKNKKDNEPLKLVFKFGFFGEKMTGKTSIIKRYISNEFKPLYSPSDSPILMEKQINIGKLEISLKIWDMQGSSCLISKITQYIDGLDGIFIVYDITNAESFHQIQNWIKEIKKDESHFTIVIIGNKSDLINQRAISSQEAEEFAKAQSIHFVETSALIPKNIEGCFTYLINERIIRSGINLNSKDLQNGAETNKKCVIF